MTQVLEAKSVNEAHGIIEKFSETQSTTVLRRLPHMKVGQAARQGDVYIQAIGQVPADFIQIKIDGDFQLVDGNTQGSRHIISQSDVENLVIYKSVSPSELVGNVIEAKEKFTVTHPEHAHFEFQPGIYKVTFQADYSEIERRVRD